MAVATKAPEIERLLTEYGVTNFEFGSVKIKDLAVAESLKLQIRFTPLDDDTVTTYAVRLLDGERPPPLIVWRCPGRGKLVLDGNQRVAAAREAGVETLDAYLLDDISEEQAKVIAWASNDHGLPLSLEERLAHAVEAVLSYGWTPVEIGRVLHLDPKAIGDRVLRMVAHKRIAASDPQLARRLLPAQLRRLSSIKSDVVLVEAAKIATMMNAAQTNAMVTAVNAGRSERMQLTVVQEHGASIEASRIEQTLGGKRSLEKPPKPDAVQSILSRACALLLKVTVWQVDDLNEKVPDEMRERLRRLLLDSSAHTLELAKRLR